MSDAELKVRLDKLEAMLTRLIVSVCGDLEGQTPGLQSRVGALEREAASRAGIYAWLAGIVGAIAASIVTAWLTVKGWQQ